VRVAILFILVASCGGRTTDPESIDGGAAKDSATVVDTSKPDAPIECVDKSGNLPVSLKACSSDADCAMRERQSDCCGSLTLVGIRAELAAAFSVCEEDRRKGLPLCDCLSQPTRAEDGREVSGFSPKVKCTDFTSSGGICKTYVE